MPGPKPFWVGKLLEIDQPTKGMITCLSWDYNSPTGALFPAHEEIVDAQGRRLKGKAGTGKQIEFTCETNNVIAWGFKLGKSKQLLKKQLDACRQSGLVPDF